MCSWFPLGEQGPPATEGVYWSPLGDGLFLFFFFFGLQVNSHHRQMMNVPNEPGLSPKNGLENAFLSSFSGVS